MSVPNGFFTDLLNAGAGVPTPSEWGEAGYGIIDLDDPDVDLHENADMTTFDVTEALLHGGAEDGHVEVEEWN